MAVTLFKCFILFLAFTFIIQATATIDRRALNVEGHSLWFESEKVKNESTCSYFYDVRHPSPEEGLINCTWYKSKSCCKPTEVTSVFSAMDPLYSATELCRNYVNYLMGFFCCPEQEIYFRSNRLHICLEYCDAMYEECRGAGFNKILIGEAYDNGTAFCEAQNYKVISSTDCFKFNPDVFGGAPQIKSLSSILTTFVVFVLLMNAVDI